MPRPEGGYKNAAGRSVPGVHDITNAYFPKPALVQWAYNRGKAGLILYGKELDIGTCVHLMAELDLRGRPPHEIDAKLHEVLGHDAEAIGSARSAFEAYCKWRDSMAIRAVAHEPVIVSERHQYGGSPDCIAFIDGEICLLDFKTCRKPPKAPYTEQLTVMAAHAVLWNEAHPDQLVTQSHIIYLPKDGSRHAHHRYANLTPQWQEFRHLLHAYANKHGSPRPADARDEKIARLKTEVAALRSEIERGAAAEAGKTLRAFAPPPPPIPRPAPPRPTPPRRTASPAQQLTLDVETGTLFSAPQLKKAPAPSLSLVPPVKPRVRMRANGSWFYVPRGYR